MESNMSEELKESINKKLGYVSSIFMSQDVKGTEIVMPTEELEEVSDQLLQLFESYAKEMIGEDENYQTSISPTMFDVEKKAVKHRAETRNKLRAEQRSRLESQKKEVKDE